MKTVKIYFEGNLVLFLLCKTIIFPSSDFQFFTLKDEKDKTVAFIPVNYMVVIENDLE